MLSVKPLWFDCSGHEGLSWWWAGTPQIKIPMKAVRQWRAWFTVAWILQIRLHWLTGLCPHSSLVAVGEVKDVTTQKSSDLLLWDGRPPHQRWIQRHAVAADVCRSPHRSCQDTEPPVGCSCWVAGNVRMRYDGGLTAFQEINVRPPISALAVVDLFHVAGVLIGSGVQNDAVSFVRLQRLLVPKTKIIK